MEKLALKLIEWLLKRDLSWETRSKLTSLVLISVDALPVKDIISVDDDGSLLVGGRKMEIEQAIHLRESARAMLGNTAYKVIRDQVAYQAITLGFHKAETERQILFGKAAIWYGQQEEVLLKLLSADGTSGL